MKSTILAFLLLCVPIFAQLTTPTPPSDSAQGNAAVSASGDDAEVEGDSEDEEAPAAPTDVDFEVSTTPLLRGKTGILAIDTLPVNEWDIPTKRNSLKYAMLFSLLPGGGQY